MILLRDYIVETGGKLPPHEIMYGKKFFDMKTKEVLSSFNTHTFKFIDLDGKHERYKIISVAHKHAALIDHLYVLDNVSSILYD